MIKIKNYIFNENEIEKINHIDIHGNRLHIIFKNNKEDYIEFATFEDIEWNYGNSISESLSYDLAKARIQELEEENKKLKETNKNLIFLKDDYFKSINKASRFIVKNAIVSDEWEEVNPSMIPADMRPTGKIIYKPLSAKKVKELDNILKGEENEKL